MRIFFLLPAGIAWLLFASPALATQCRCERVKASSESTGVCNRLEDQSSCHMVWATKTDGGVSLSPFHKDILGQSFENLKKIQDSQFNFNLQGTGSPVAIGPRYLIDTPPSKYGGDESLSPYLLMLHAGMQKLGMKDAQEVALEITKNKSEVITALKSDAVLSLSLKDGALLISKGCLEFKRPAGSVMVNTPFSGKAASCG